MNTVQTTRIDAAALIGRAAHPIVGAADDYDQLIASRGRSADRAHR